MIGCLFEQSGTFKRVFIMRDIQRAEKCGLSYGHFKALQRETGEAWKEYKAGNVKHFDRVVKRFGRTLRTAEKQR